MPQRNCDTAINHFLLGFSVPEAMRRSRARAAIAKKQVDNKESLKDGCKENWSTPANLSELAGLLLTYY